MATAVFLTRGLVLTPNYPNLFDAGTLIRFRLGEEGPVRLTSVDVTGWLVRLLVDGV